MLKFKYTCGARELTDLVMRAYFHSERARRDRLKDSLLNSLWAVLGFALVLWFHDGMWAPWWVYPIAYAAVCFLVYQNFPYNTAKRIKGEARKAQKNVPAYEVSYRVGDGKFDLFAQDTGFISQIEDIVWVGRDEHYLEVSLTDKRHHAIPLTAFENEQQIEALLAALGNPPLRDLSDHSDWVPMPTETQLKKGIRMSLLPWCIIAVCGTLLGLVVLVVNIHAVGFDGVTNPLGYIAVGMLVFGLISAVVVMRCWNK
ncbi:MAG TPA: hypothetical protein V6D20_05780 [Candidatus Obscuribacterales bacterium]